MEKEIAIKEYIGEFKPFYTFNEVVDICDTIIKTKTPNKETFMKAAEVEGKNTYPNYRKSFTHDSHDHYVWMESARWAFEQLKKD